MTRKISEVPLGDLNNDQLEELGRALDKPFEVDKRKDHKKIVKALEQHVQATGAELTKDWPFQADPPATGPSLPPVAQPPAKSVSDAEIERLAEFLTETVPDEADREKNPIDLAITIVQRAIDYRKSKALANAELDRLAEFILGSVPGEPSQDESAVDTAIRLIKEGRDLSARGDSASAEIKRLEKFLIEETPIQPGPGEDNGVATAIRVIKQSITAKASMQPRAGGFGRGARQEVVAEIDRLIADTVVPPATQVYLQPHERRYREDLHARLEKVRAQIGTQHGG